ncbi:hypothetical protein LLS1_01560 [Leifsonia sp. LS1]|nr:hypothetical protein LLS1_01560 [Leifsonia sp. LS1]
MPQMLLRNFRGPDGNLRVFAIDRDASYISKTAGVGQVKGGHDRIAFDGTVDREFLEQWMSRLEGAAAGEIATIVTSRDLTISPDEFPTLPWLASLQFNRSRALMGYLKTRVPADGGTGTDLEVQTAILNVTAYRVLSAWEASKEALGDPKDQWDPMVSVLRSLRWDVMRYERPRLLVSDGFAAQFGVAAKHADRYGSTEKNWAKHGVGVPQHQASAFTIPLTPQVAIHLHAGSVRKYVSAQQVNQRTIYAARSFVAMPSDWVLPDQALGDVSDWLKTQRFVRSMIARNA